LLAPEALFSGLCGVFGFARWEYRVFAKPG
jgi:hypothetical protein